MLASLGSGRFLTLSTAAHHTYTVATQCIPASWLTQGELRGSFSAVPISPTIASGRRGPLLQPPIQSSCLAGRREKITGEEELVCEERVEGIWGPTRAIVLPYLKVLDLWIHPWWMKTLETICLHLTCKTFPFVNILKRAECNNYGCNICSVGDINVLAFFLLQW